MKMEATQNNYSPERNDSSKVVIQSPSKYGVWLIVLLLFAPTVVGIQLILALKNDDSAEKRKLIRAIISLIFALLIVYGVVLPRGFQVLSDKSVRVVTMLGLKWKFSGVTEAYRLSSMWSEWARPKFKFATTFESSHLIVVKRQGWDVLVSPTDGDEFLRAINGENDVHNEA